MRGDIRIIVDLPNEDMLKALKLKPMGEHYNSERLKKHLMWRLSREFSEAKTIKVNIVPTNAFFGVDVMGLDTEEVLAAMKKVSDIILSSIEETGHSLVRH